MATLNHSGEEIKVKIVYYGPGLSGKTTTLDFLQTNAPARSKGNIVTATTRTDRTLSFDFVPPEFSDLNGYQIKYQLCTVPGEVFYNATRKLVLEGVDAIVFVADSSRDKLRENIEVLRNLEENLNEYGISLDHLPWVIQYNKRDLPDAVPVEELHKHLNLLNVPAFETVATEGRGVYETFKNTAATIYTRLLKKFDGIKMTADQKAEQPVAAQPAPPVQDAYGEKQDNEVSDAVDAAFREVNLGERYTAPKPGQVVTAPVEDIPRPQVSEEVSKAIPGMSASPTYEPSAADSAPPVEENTPEPSLPQAQEQSEEMWAQSVGSAVETDFREDSPAQPPASAPEFPAPHAAETQVATQSSPEIDEASSLTPGAELHSNAEKAFSFTPEITDEPMDDVGRLVELDKDEDEDPVSDETKPEIPEFITDPMQRRVVSEEEEAVEDIEWQSPVVIDCDAGPREDCQLTVPVVISRSQIKKTIPLKLVLEIQIVDD